MILVLLIMSVVLAALLLAPAWGPGLHIQLTQRLLTQFRVRSRLRPDQALVLEYPDSFLYGNVAADIINFKSFGGIKNNCHNWNIQERLESASTARDARAFILGYLCHLAADVIAHNHFIPYHMICNFPPRMLGHPYWEAIADAGMSDTEWHTVDRLKDNAQIHTYDMMVHRAVRMRVLGLRSNRWIFNNILLSSCRRNWRDFIRSVHNQAKRHPLDEAFTASCREHSYLNMLSVFYMRRLALLKTKDPTGRQTLRGARALRRELVRGFGRRQVPKSTANVLAAQAYGLPAITIPSQRKKNEHGIDSPN